MSELARNIRIWLCDLIHGACIIYSIAAVMSSGSDAVKRHFAARVFRKAAQAPKWSMPENSWRNNFNPCS